MDYKDYLLVGSVFLFSGLTLAQSPNDTTAVEMTLNLSQVFLSILAIAGISYSAYLLRGGMLAKPMAAIGVGLTIFALERTWQGMAKLGYVAAMDSLTASYIYQMSAIMIAGGYVYVALVLKN